MQNNAAEKLDSAFRSVIKARTKKDPQLGWTNLGGSLGGKQAFYLPGSANNCLISSVGEVAERSKAAVSKTVVG